MLEDAKLEINVNCAVKPRLTNSRTAEIIDIWVRKLLTNLMKSFLKRLQVFIDGEGNLNKYSTELASGAVH